MVGRSHVPRLALSIFNESNVSVHYTSRLFVSLEVFTRCAPFDFDINCTLIIVLSATDS